jgi:putative solute:sodium symporter small subunit
MTKRTSKAIALRFHWMKTQRLTGVLLLFWFSVTISVIWFADELNRIELIGPMGFYMAAQGVLIVYVVIIWVYVKRMRQLDQQATSSGRME